PLAMPLSVMSALSVGSQSESSDCASWNTTTPTRSRQWGRRYRPRSFRSMCDLLFVRRVGAAGAGGDAGGCARGREDDERSSGDAEKGDPGALVHAEGIPLV